MKKLNCFKIYRLLSNAKDCAERELSVSLEDGPQILAKSVGDHESVSHSFDLVRAGSVKDGEIQVREFLLPHIVVN
jgi:hypothetical protein